MSNQNDKLVIVETGVGCMTQQSASEAAKDAIEKSEVIKFPDNGDIVTLDSNGNETIIKGF